ncbi:elongation factor 4 [Candidatus Berkelbacteria bacterium]|nr:elongation factor 4 [Candidatus Berkelbacteria bacterium]
MQNFVKGKVRNFCIIAHIDHGKSTLADRFIEATQTVSEREMRAQLLDTMELERERGITIKLQPVKMEYQGYVLNLIDTPGHVDFTYEVSRSLAAVEGAILLVDATQGVQAQTLTTLHQAQNAGLTLIPVVNKIDLLNAEPEQTAQELVQILNCSLDEILFVSGKTGEGMPALLQAIIERVPSPACETDQPLRALIFDSVYDAYRGVISYVRVMEGTLAAGAPIELMHSKRCDTALEVGIFTPALKVASELSAGLIGYVVTGVKNVSEARVGDTLTSLPRAQTALVGYREITPMVYAGIFSTNGEPEALREALSKLKLNDAALQYEPDHSQAFGFGFRCGFLGLLHLEIITERLEREYNLELIVTTPSVAYHERVEGGRIIYAEPWVKTEIIVPTRWIGPVMELAQIERGIYQEQETEYLRDLNAERERVILRYQLPLASVIVNFYDRLKSVSSGYASLNYSPLDYREEDLIKLNILIAGDSIEELSQIVHRTQAFERGQALVTKLKTLIPRQQFEVALQAAIGGKIIARETIPAMRKDVTAKLYGGDRTRKDKLLKKQKAGKKRLRKLGKVDIPSDVFIKLLR